MRTNENSQKFWEKDDNGKIKIIQSKLIAFLSKSGFSKAEISDTDYTLVREYENTVKEIADYVIVDYVKRYLLSIKEMDVYEAFIKASSTLISKPKLRFLKTVKLLNDRDDAKTSWFHFQNLSWQVGKKSLSSRLREDFQGKIWKSRILPYDCYYVKDDDESQFQKFCFNISGKNKHRFKALTTIIGYLLHRNQDPGNAKAIIFIDENISFDGTANGGTGKSLLVRAMGKCRELVVMDGKNIKHKSWFKNQRINRTTDLVFYDDVGRDFSLETLYSMITTGVTVEKKYKAEEYILPENAPKIIISSNYVVNGTGGSTDIRRRCEFEVANHYDDTFTPEDEFGNYFFDDWDKGEWNRFFHFMMECVQQYLKNGLIIPNPINLKKNRLINATCEEFVAFMELDLVERNKWLNKKDVLNLYISEYRHYNNLSSHQMTKWIKEYARQNELIYEDRKSGEKYEMYLKELRKEVSDEEE
ncbi:primase-helicase family protein [Aestuariivivens sediminis]|uniref:primase-helicase family protein n=1 Tax=Aestuariivivens sediminis TaxID=2913557 RepID=UPI001F590A07|nr:primase-helicase family protein [Aestuariivivens sediminis]